MHPACIPSASPFTLVEDSSLSPTFCSSLDPCSSHGFSSLQSPSAFFSNDSSQQIQGLQPLGLDSAELCGCHLRHCCREAGLDITQGGSASHGNLNTLSSEGPLLHDADSQKHACPFHSSPERVPSRNCKHLQIELGLDCILKESPLQESASAEPSISLPPCPSLWKNTESSALPPIQDGCNENEHPVFHEFDPRFLSSSPDAREHSNSLLTDNSNDRQVDKTQQFKALKADNQINDTACIEAHATHSSYQSSCPMAPEVLSSARTSLSHSFPVLITRPGDADDKENFIAHIHDGSRERQVQLLDNRPPYCSVKSKLNHKREGKKEALQEAHENKKSMSFPCKEEMFLDVNDVDEASKENISPDVFDHILKRVGGPKADVNGWMCPKDAKKNFKVKPRQLLLDKWLTRQR